MVFHRNLFLVRYYSCCTLPTLSSWSKLKSYTVFLCICMLITVKYTASVRRHQSTSYRCACRPVLSTLPTGCHQIDCMLNANRTVFLWCTSSARRQSHLPASPSRVCSDYMTPSTVVQDLGIYLDSDVSMRSQATRTVSHCFGILRQLRSIRRSLSHSDFQSLVAALLLTKLEMPHWSVSRRSS